MTPADPYGSLNRAISNLAPKRALLVACAVGLASLAYLIPSDIASRVLLTLSAAAVFCLLIVQFLRRDGKPGSPEVELGEIIEHDPRAVLVTDLAGQVRLKNPAARERFGAETDVALDRALDQISTNVGAAIFRAQTRALQSNSGREYLITRKGRYSLTASRLGSDRLLWAVEDLSDRSVMTKSVDKINLPMLTAGSSGTILFMNDAMRRLAGERVKSLDALFTTVPERTDMVATLTTRDGPVDVRVTRLNSAAGRVEFFFSPVDRHNRHVETLDTLEDFPVALIKLSSEGIVQEANKLARSLISLEECRGLALFDILDGLGRPISDWLSEAADGRSLNKPQVLRVTNSEAEIYLQVTLGRVIRGGEVTLLAMLSDATELKSLEKQFVQSQKMQAIGQLAGGVAHDFNNLLTAISGHCDLLMLGHDPGDPEYGDLEQINQNANRAASLVGQLLAFSRKQNLQLEVIDMRDTLADLTHLLNRLVGAQISLTLDHDPQLMSVRTDRRQMEQVIMNLVVNARDAMNDSGGEIRIETRNVKLHSDMRRDRALVPRGDYVVVKVADNGCGISDDKLAKIFEPFYTTKRTGEGTGLGLSTAYGIVKQSGGFIFVNSEVGSGTCFTIYFPSCEAPEPQPLAPPKPPVKIETSPVEGRVLLVEDEAPVRAFAARALSLRGFEVTQASNAEEALDILGESKMSFDVVVSDVVMPGMDGPTWVQKARETHPDLRVVFVSGYAEDSFGDAQAALPNTVFLPKPFSLNDLTNMVQGQINLAA